MGKRFRRNTRPKLMAQIRALNTKVFNSDNEITHRDEQQLSISDKLVWAYKEIGAFKAKKKSVIAEIVTVAYITTINEKEYTVIYYDSTHDKILHMHLYKSVQDSTDTVLPLPIRKRGNQSKLLNWALKDIRNKWYYYRRKFYKRSGLISEF